jgi:hypothetical protein
LAEAIRLRRELIHAVKPQCHCFVGLPTELGEAVRFSRYQNMLVTSPSNTFAADHVLDVSSVRILTLGQGSKRGQRDRAEFLVKLYDTESAIRAEEPATFP